MATHSLNKYLEEIVIDENELEFLDYKSFFGLPKLRRLSMSFNCLNLSHIYPDDLLAPLPNLTILNIGKNLKRNANMSDSLFYNVPVNKLSNLRELVPAKHPVFSHNFKLLVNL